MTDAAETDAPNRYTNPQIGLHGLMALLIFGLYAFGLSLESFDKSIRPPLVNLHALGGLLVIALAVARIALRIKNPPPPFPASMGPQFAKAAHWGHVALYFMMLAVPLHGLVARWLHGRGLNFFLFEIPSPFAADKELGHTMGEAHELTAHILMILVAGHVLFALYHQFVLRDDLFSRINPRKQ